MRIIIFIIMGWSTFALGSTQSEIDELKKRIDDLEKQQAIFLSTSAEPRPQVNSFLRDNFTLGGFFDGGYNFITGPDTETQAVNDGNVIGLNFAADYGNNYRFVAQMIAATNMRLENRENNPNATPETREYNTYIPIGAVTQGYVEYTASRKMNVQAGIGYVPFGFALQLRDPVLYVRRGGPQLVRNASMVSILWQGVHLYGAHDFRDGEIGYNFYTFTPTTEAHFPGVGARVWMSNDDERIVAGLNTQFAEKDDETFSIAGADLRFNFHPFQLRTEAIHKFTQDSDSWSGYIEPGLYIFEEEILIYAFGDYLFGAQNEVATLAGSRPDPIQKWEYGGGLNWLPTSYTRFRLGITFHDYVGYRAKTQGQNRDYFSTDFSLGVAF